MPLMSPKQERTDRLASRTGLIAAGMSDDVVRKVLYIRPASAGRLPHARPTGLLGWLIFVLTIAAAGLLAAGVLLALVRFSGVSPG
jgi:hypothetical protein